MSKAKDGKKKERRLNDGNNNGQLRIANATSGRASKAAKANNLIQCFTTRQACEEKKNKSINFLILAMLMS